MFTIEKDLSGIFWHIYNNARTRVNVSDFDVVIDSISQTFIIQCKNGSNIPSQAIAINLMQVIDLSVGTSPIAFSGAEGLIQLLMAKNYTPYLQDAPSESVYVYRVGQVGVFTMTPTQFTDNFDGTGLGRNTMLGWALRNGSNGTKNQQGKFSLNKGASPYDVIGAIGGSPNAVLIGHKHTFSGSAAGTTGGGSVSTGNQDEGGGSFFMTNTGLSENGVSVPDQSGVGKNMPPYLIDVWVERVSDLVITTGSGGGGGGGGVQTVTGLTVTGTATDRVVGVPTLQQVTDDGNNETTNDIIVKDSESKISLRPKNINFQDIDGGGDTSLRFEDTSEISQEVFIRGLGGTMALTTDIPTLVAGTNITIDDADPLNPIISSTGGGIPTFQEVVNEDDIITIPFTHRGTFFENIFNSSGINIKDILSPASSGINYQLNGIFRNYAGLTQALIFDEFEGTGATYRAITIPNKTGIMATLDDIPSGGGTVTSVDLLMPSAFTVTNNPVTTSGTLTVTGAGSVSQYVRGDGTLANFPASSGGGSSLSFYLNGSISQGTIGGIAFREMDRTPILGAGTDFTINANGYIQSFITDAGVPNQLEIPAGNWNFETYFSASSGGGTPSFYVELYKWDGTTLTLIASNSANPEAITNGTVTDLYVSALAIPQTTLLATDRLAVRIYVTHSGRTIKLHTENGHLCQVITTFSTGLTALNGLTAQVQIFDEGTSGTDFNISSVADTHIFNLPTASAINRGALSAEDWSAFNSKLSDAAFQFTRRLITNGTGSVTGTTAETILTSLTIPANTLDSKCFIWTTMDYFKTNTGSCTLRLYINTTNSVSGATLIGFVTIASNRNVSFNRKLYLNGTTLDFLNSNTGATQVSNEFIESLFGASTTLTVNPAANIFLIYTTINDAVGTVATNKQATVQKLKLN
jgi:hypothetical protein